MNAAVEQSIVEQRGNDLIVTSETIADRTGVEHRAVLQLVNSHVESLEVFGDLAFEMRDRPGAPGPALRVALLNEQQATLVMTFMRNSGIVTAFKLELVKQFYAMREALKPRGHELIALAVIEAQAMLAQKNAQIAELEPKADAWDDLVSADGDYAVSDAAKILARAGVETGATRLFNQLADMRWIFRRGGKWAAYQEAVDNGYLAERPQSHFHPRTGEKVLDAPQVRVTMRGLERLRIRLGSLVVVPPG